jgi:lipopolysaccharide/colanic/teichoic acid biosynthesis glycosyltransferase
MTLLLNITSLRDEYEGDDDVARSDAETATRGAYLPFKLCLGWMAALLLLVILAPLMMVLTILVKLTSDGPAFYSQFRLGRGGRPFRIYKLRTMDHQCEANTGPVWSGADDPRVTKIGRWLRDTHLDEIPQLLNVLRGEMSLIGPRPERPEIAGRIELTLPDFKNRLVVRPGITGLAQIRMPADTDLDAVHRKLTHDLYYIRHVSLALDARVLFATAFHFLGAAAVSISRCLIRPHSPVVEERPSPIADRWNEEADYRIDVVCARAA